MTGEPVAALYVYDAYSPFENMVNYYMSTSIPIVPGFREGGVGGLMMNQSSSPISQGIPSFSAIPPTPSEEIKVLD